MGKCAIGNHSNVDLTAAGIDHKRITLSTILTNQRRFGRISIINLYNYVYEQWQGITF